MKSDYGSVNASAYTPMYYQWENFLNYTQGFGLHNVNAMLGASYIRSRNFGVGGSMEGSVDDFGFRKDDPLFMYFAYGTATAVKNLNGGEESLSSKISYFGRLLYNYAEKYFVQASLRADAADLSVLPIEKRWGYFPAVSAGWTMSNENFMKSTRNWLSSLKLRASWGQNGTTATLGGYSYATSISSGSSYPFSNDVAYNTGSSPNVTGNTELKWETSEQLDFGFDARFLHDRLTLSADYFVKKTKDLIVSGITPSTIVGNTASPVNAGNIENRGIELELGWRDHIGELNYSIRGNIATLKNKVTYLHESLTRIQGASFHTTYGITSFEKGYPAWYFYGYSVDRIAETDIFGKNDKGETIKLYSAGDPVFNELLTVDSDGDGVYDATDGVINDGDRRMIGSPIPDFTYGITLTAAYKGFDFMVFGTGSYGNDILMCLTRGDRKQANLPKEYYDDRWTPTNTVASRPRPGAKDIGLYWVSDAVVYDGSYFKIKQIQLGYTLPKSLLSKVAINNMRIYCSLDDFFTFTSYPGFDPEFVGSGINNGVDKGFYPASRKVVFGLNITF
jgi:TonB-linked SusC/RagA family outer membrane protein